jgi:hypothetical protein
MATKSKELVDSEMADKIARVLLCCSANYCGVMVPVSEATFLGPMYEVRCPQHKGYTSKYRHVWERKHSKIPSIYHECPFLFKLEMDGDACVDCGNVNPSIYGHSTRTMSAKKEIIPEECIEVQQENGWWSWIKSCNSNWACSECFDKYHIPRKQPERQCKKPKFYHD